MILLVLLLKVILCVIKEYKFNFYFVVCYYLVRKGLTIGTSKKERVSTNCGRRSTTLREGERERLPHWWFLIDDRDYLATSLNIGRMKQISTLEKEQGVCKDCSNHNIGYKIRSFHSRRILLCYASTRGQHLRNTSQRRCGLFWPFLNKEGWHSYVRGLLRWQVAFSGYWLHLEFELQSSS